MEWLTEEEQYKDGLTSREIERIKDEELRNIRRKYRERMLRNFHDEKNIRDKELMRMWREDQEEEKKEIEEYRKRKGI
jgi:hypothetical protein